MPEITKCPPGFAFGYAPLDVPEGWIESLAKEVEKLDVVGMNTGIPHDIRKAKNAKGGRAYRNYRRNI